jgi:hypothetical protein
MRSDASTTSMARNPARAIGICGPAYSISPSAVFSRPVRRDKPFRSAIREHLKGHTQGLEELAIEMLARGRGLSVRDIEDAFKDENGRLLLSKTAASQLGERLWEDYQACAQRDLSEYEITYLCLWMASPSVCGLAPNASRFWRPGASRSRAVACCCT